MLTFFVEPYPNELLYSAFARYHFYNGNIDLKDTSEELFGNRNIIPSIEFASNLDGLIKQLSGGYTLESLVNDHTTFKYYKPFISYERQVQFMDDISTNSVAPIQRIGLVANQLSYKKRLYFCAKCVEKDGKVYGEGYFHREHHLPGIHVCPTHHQELTEYPIQPNDVSRHRYIRLNIHQIELAKFDNDLTSPHLDIQIQLSKLAVALINHDQATINVQRMKQLYKNKLQERELLTIHQQVRQKELYESFVNFYPQDFLVRYKCFPLENDEFSWLKNINRNKKILVHPFQHMLFMHFLGISIANLDVAAGNNPFGEGPYPCLNRAAPHYRQHTIDKVIITRDFKTKNPIGTFECGCGFIYARKGPDKKTEDKYRIGRTKAYGDLWLERLYQLSKERLSVRSIARELGVDSKTINKYINDSQPIKKPDLKNRTLEHQYKEVLLKYINEHPDSSRKEIRSRNPKEFMFVYRNDKMWLEAQLPNPRRIQSQNYRVDWSLRDEQTVEQIEKVYIEMIGNEKPVRITKSAIGHKLGVAALLNIHLNKLPKTKGFLDSFCETIEEYQLRRCYRAIDKLKEERGIVQWWRVQKLAGIRKDVFLNLEDKLHKYLWGD